MTKEVRKLVTDRYLSWSELWGLSLAFAVTQNVEKAERAVADAIVALIATDAGQEALALAEARANRFSRVVDPDGARAAVRTGKVSVNAIRFAGAVWELANAQAFRGFGADAFFRMPAVARAISVLKSKAQFSRTQIATALRIEPAQVDDHLENARLLFTDGRSWLQHSADLVIEGDRWTPACPQWNATAPRSDSEGLDIQGVFAQYVGNDLEPEAHSKLHSHLVVCTTCRSSLAHFKKQYSDWIGSIPTIETDRELRKHLTKVTKMALKMSRVAPPRAMPGLRKLLRDGQAQAMVLGAGAVMLFQLIAHHHLPRPHVPGFVKKAFHRVYHASYHDKSGR